MSDYIKERLDRIEDKLDKLFDAHYGLKVKVYTTSGVIAAIIAIATAFIKK